MTCRCRSKEEHAERAERRVREEKNAEIQEMREELESLRADIKSFGIKNVSANGEYLVLDVEYFHPDGKALKGCTFNGRKIMVFKASVVDALHWRAIDPHFREDDKKRKLTQAPSPIARFPGNDIGWVSAMMFVQLLVEKRAKHIQ